VNTLSEDDKQVIDTIGRGEAGRALPYRAVSFVQEDSKTKCSLNPAMGLAESAFSITECVKKLTDSDEILFRVRQNTSRDGTQTWPVLGTGKLGEELLSCLKRDLDWITDTYPIERFNPYFRLFKQAVTRDSDADILGVPGCDLRFCASNQNALSDRGLRTFAVGLNEAVGRIRNEGKSEPFVDWVKAFERQPKANYETLVSLIRANQAACHHLLVLRIDLGYSQYYCNPALSGEQAVSYEEVRRNRVTLIRFIKRRLPKGAYRGYALKLEFGLDKTYHYHVLVLLDGDVVREDAKIAKIICEYWERFITDGKGGAYNCNAATYKEPGIGSVKYDNAKKRAILETIVAAYLAKPDFYILMTKPDGHHAFWTSQPPKIRAKRRGRKRSKADALESVTDFPTQ
jgi:hypothetical protein